MHFSDLHIHSRYSDGMLWPEEIVNIACRKGLKYLSITDHDTIDSQYLVEELNAKCSITSIPGVELSTEFREKEIHMLGYFINIYNDDLKSTLNTVRESRICRAKEIIDKLNNLNIDISFEEILQDNVSIGRPHIARAIVNKGYTSNIKDAFRQYLIKGKPGYVDRFKINYKDALKLISNCNGISVLAHPGEIYKGISVEEIIKEFKVYGLKGIEVFHPSHSIKQINSFYNLAKKYSLVITGGSDCHGIAYQDEMLIGTAGIDENLTNKFLKMNCYK